MSEYRVRITDNTFTFIVDAVLPTYAMAHRFIDDQELHDGDVVELYNPRSTLYFSCAPIHEHRRMVPAMAGLRSRSASDVCFSQQQGVLM